MSYRAQHKKASPKRTYLGVDDLLVQRGVLFAALVGSLVCWAIINPPKESSE